MLSPKIVYEPEVDPNFSKMGTDYRECGDIYTTRGYSDPATSNLDIICQ